MISSRTLSMFCSGEIRTPKRRSTPRTTTRTAATTGDSTLTTSAMTPEARAAVRSGSLIA